MAPRRLQPSTLLHKFRSQTRARPSVSRTQPDTRPQVKHGIFECHQAIAGHEVHQERQQHKGDESHEDHESQE